MRRIAFSLSLLIALVLMAALPATAAHAAAPAQAQWTVMVYMSGDNNLEPYIVSDIETELAPTGSSASVQVVALADRGPGYDTSRGDWQTTKLYHVTKGMIADAASAVADWGERDMGDPQTLIDFVTWTKSHYPANHYALFFWGHGWNWHPGYVMLDNTVPGTTLSDTLDYQEEKTAIPSLGFVDVVGYDGCNMASIEIFNLWHGHATAVTGSQEYVGWEGVQYDLVLAQLAANPAMTADQVAILTTQTANQDKTWSAVAVDGRFDALLSAVNTWSVALNGGLSKYRKQYDQAFTATRTFWQAPMDKDLYDMAYQIKSNVPDANIKSKSQAVMDAFSAAVLAERHVNSYASVHGITIYHISKAVDKDSNYAYYRSTVDFALQTAWDEFLEAYAVK
jgi:hypothetical protein